MLNMPGRSDFATKAEPHLTGEVVLEAFEKYKSEKYFANLDGLRFFCIFAVVWHHNQPLHLDGVRILDRGFLGVAFFFVLSGFLITTLLLREEEKTGRFSITKFYIRRILRIFPVYYFVVTAIVVYYIFIRGEWDKLDTVPAYYLFLSNFLTKDLPILGITWSLSVEEQFYMVWPLLLLLAPRRRRPAIALLLIAINVAIVSGVPPVPTPEIGPLTFKLHAATYAPLFMGSLLAMLLHRRETFAALHRFTAAWYAPVIGLIVLLLVVQFSAEDVRGLPNLAIHGAMTYLLATLVIRQGTVFTPVLATPLIARIGVVSYGVYLYHLVALDVVERGLTAVKVSNEWFVLILYFALAVVIAEISYRTVEAAFRRLRPQRGMTVRARAACGATSLREPARKAVDRFARECPNETGTDESRPRPSPPHPLTGARMSLQTNSS